MKITHAISSDNNFGQIALFHMSIALVRSFNLQEEKKLCRALT